MVALNGDILCLLDVVDTFQYRQPMADTGNAHALQVVMLERDQSLPDDFIVCKGSPQPRVVESVQSVTSDGSWCAAAATIVHIGYGWKEGRGGRPRSRDFKRRSEKVVTHQQNRRHTEAGQ